MFINIMFKNGTKVSIEVTAYFFSATNCHMYRLVSGKWVSIKPEFINMATVSTVKYN